MLMPFLGWGSLVNINNTELKKKNAGTIESITSISSSCEIIKVNRFTINAMM